VPVVLAEPGTPASMPTEHLLLFYAAAALPLVQVPVKHAARCFLASIHHD